MGHCTTSRQSRTFGTGWGALGGEDSSATEVTAGAGHRTHCTGRVSGELGGAQNRAGASTREEPEASEGMVPFDTSDLEPSMHGGLRGRARQRQALHPCPLQCPCHAVASTRPRSTPHAAACPPGTLEGAASTATSARWSSCGADEGGGLAREGWPGGGGRGGGDSSPQCCPEQRAVPGGFHQHGWVGGSACGVSRPKGGRGRAPLALPGPGFWAF